jgi:serine phosphatase RsbU (regulator of sigma subunit)
VFYVRACGPSQRLFLTALFCLALVVGWPVSAGAERDRAPTASAAAKPDGNGQTTGLLRRAKPGGGTPDSGKPSGSQSGSEEVTSGAGRNGASKPDRGASANPSAGKPDGGGAKPDGGNPGRGRGHGYGHEHHHGKPNGDGGGDGGGQPSGGDEEPAEPPGGGGGDIPVESGPPATTATTPSLAVPATPTAPPTPAPVSAPAPTAPSTPAPAGQAPRASDRPGAPVRDRRRTPTDASGVSPSTATGLASAAPFGALPASAVSAAAPDRRRTTKKASDKPKTVTRTVVRTVQRAVEVVPGFLWALIAGLAALSLAATAASSLLARRARRLDRQRAELLQDVGLLQAALLPDAPAQIAGAAAATAAYRPATSGPAGGDFYDVFALDTERLGIIVGRVSATGKRALGVTAHIRHVLRAYLEGGLAPRNALQVGADVLERHLGPDYACATVAIFDSATSQLTYAGAGMPAPIVLGSAAFEPVTSCAAPAIGMGVATGTRQTSVVLPAGATACLFTDGLLDGRIGGGRYGYRRASQAVEGLDAQGGADALLDRIATEADTSVDDTAVVMLRVEGRPADAILGGERRLEELELGSRELDGDRPVDFLRDCGVPTDTIPAMIEELRATATRLGGAVLRVRFGPGVPEAETGLRTMEILSAGAGPSA